MQLCVHYRLHLSPNLCLKLFWSQSSGLPTSLPCPHADALVSISRPECRRQKRESPESHHKVFRRIGLPINGISRKVSETPSQVLPQVMFRRCCRGASLRDRVRIQTSTVLLQWQCYVNRDNNFGHNNKNFVIDSDRQLFYYSDNFIIRTII